MSLLSASPPSTQEPEAPGRGRGAFVRFAWCVVAYNVLVILWGTYVRAAGAGNGCGPNWPLCDGQFLPAHPKIKMLIEFLHRASSGVDAVLILILALGAWWLYPKHHAVRRAAAGAVLFLITEALLGAALVLFGWVGTNTSAARVAADATHLANTLCLLAALVLTAAWASGMPGLVWRGQRLRGRLSAALILLVLTAICGAMAALADTLFPATTLAAGLRQDFSGTTALLERLRVIHPFVAVAVGFYLLWLVFEGMPKPETRATRLLGYGVAAAVVLQWACGALDVVLLTPIWMQITHLLTADLLWLVLVLYVAAWWAGRNYATFAACAS